MKVPFVAYYAMKVPFVASPHTVASMAHELTRRAAPFRMRPRVLVPPRPELPSTAPPGGSAVVVGGGIAGISAAVVLAERGVEVTVLEAAPFLGGRLGAWDERTPDGNTGEHGFHAFFRHYYTWRSILRRIDADLSFLAPVDGYPVIAREWPDEDLTGLPTAPPLNLLALFRRSPSLVLRELVHAEQVLARELLAYDRTRTARLFDDITAADYLAALRMSDRAQGMLFEAFARSFFNDQSAMSAAELIAMFHYYFLGNPEGIGFDVPSGDYRSCIWDPLAAYLRARGADVRTGAGVLALRRAGTGWVVETDSGSLDTDHVILAVDPGALRSIVEKSPDVSGDLRRQVEQLQIAPPFAVTRLWLDGDVDPTRPWFAAVTRESTLDSISCYHRFQEPARAWSAQTGGAVLELHSYACTEPTAAQASNRMTEQLHALWPETAVASIVHLTERLEAGAPAFPPKGNGRNPAVRSGVPGIRLAGDYVTTEFCTGLMERAAVTGVLAANDILATWGVAPEPVFGIPQRGLLAGLLPDRSVRRALSRL